MAKKKVEIVDVKPEEGKHNLEYMDRNGKRQFLILEDQHFNKYEQLKADYKISRDYIHTHWIHIWNKAVKSYLMHTGDRDMYIKDWQSNIHLGLIREKIDVYISFLEDIPMQFVTNGLDEAANTTIRNGKTNVDYVRNTVNYIADITDFKEQAALGLVEGMQMGTTVFKTQFHSFGEEELILPAFINWEFVDVTYRPKQINTPMSECLDTYHVFPDPFNGNKPRYVVERNIIKTSSFVEIFGWLIYGPDNQIHIEKDALADILTNQNNADFADFGNIRQDIYKYHNDLFSKSCSLYKNNRPTDGVGSTTSSTQTTESKTDRVEYQLGTYEDRVVLVANNYPVFVGDNKDGKIMYEFIQAYHSREIFTEWPALLLSGLEDSQNSFYNNYVDNARAAAHARWIASRGDFQGTPSIEDLPPGWTLWADRVTENTYRPMQSPPVTDYGIMNLSDYYSQKLSWVSEIDSGRASKLRVAAEGASLAGATNRRLNGYVKRYMAGTSEVASDWIYLFQKHLTAQLAKTPEKSTVWAYCKDIDGNVKTFDVGPKDLEGAYKVTLDGQGFFAMNKESELQKKMDAFARFEKHLAPPQIKAHMQSIYRDMNMNPAIFLPEEAPIVEQPKEGTPPPSPIEWLYGELTPEQGQGQDIAAAMNAMGPADLGNGWEWQQ